MEQIFSSAVTSVVGAIVTALFGYLTFRVRRLGKKIKEYEAVRSGVRALLRDRIIQTYNHYMEKGYCPIYSMENAEGMYIEYQRLGGNGTVVKLMEDLKALPTEPAKAHAAKV